jgi:hypothetical protein
MACCGHGRPEQAYVVLVPPERWKPGLDPWHYREDQKQTLSGEDALAWFAEHGVGPAEQGG